MSWKGHSGVDTPWVALPSAVAGTTRYRVVNRVVYLHVEGNLSSPTGTGVPVVAAGTIPTRLRPSGTIAGHASCDLFPGTIVAFTDGGVAVAQFSGATRATLVAMISWPIG